MAETAVEGKKAAPSNVEGTANKAVAVVSNSHRQPERSGNLSSFTEQVFSNLDKRAKLEAKHKIRLDRLLDSRSNQRPFLKVPPGSFGPPGAGVPYHTR